MHEIGFSKSLEKPIRLKVYIVVKSKVMKFNLSLDESRIRTFKWNI